MAKRPLMLDTSFLITYSDPGRAHHSVARYYFCEAIRQGIPLLASTIVVAEFQRKQSFATLGLNNFRITPFNFDDALEAARLSSSLIAPSADGERACLAADVKIIAQASRAGAIALLTEDRKTMAKQVDLLRGLALVDLHPILLADGFDSSRLANPSNPQLQFPQHTP